MKVISVNVGRPRLISWNGQTYSSGIFKEPVPGRIALRKLNLDGDRQADLSVHGGVNKAVYGYPSEHYADWLDELSKQQLPWGSFGENFSTEGMLEANVCIGDQYRVGSAVVKVTTPRLPCLKLAAKFRDDTMIARFVHSGRCGFYFSVVEEGEVGAGDELQLIAGENPKLTIAECNHLYISPTPEPALLQRATDVESLPQGWRDRFQAKLAALSAENKV